MSDPARRVALYGLLGIGNIGNDASFETVLGWLRGEHPEVEVACITPVPDEMEARYGVRSVSLRRRPRTASEGRGGRAKLLRRFLDIPHTWRLAGSYDAVIIPGMGVLEETLAVRPGGFPLSMFLMAAFCRLRGRRFILLDVGAEPVTRVTRRLFVATARLAAHLSYRDEWSAEAMRRAGGREPDALAPDLAFGHPVQVTVEREPGLLVVGVMAYHGWQDDPIRGAGVRSRYVTALADAVIRLIDSGDRIVLLGGDQVDHRVAHEVAATVRSARPDLEEDRIIVREVNTFSELTAEMARAEAVVASRFHNLICSLKLAVPTVSVGYATKNSRLMRDLGMADSCQDIGELDPDRLVTQLTNVRRDAHEVTTSLRASADEYATTVGALLHQVAVEVLQLPDQAWALNA